jgi:hypothetical protein
MTDPETPHQDKHERKRDAVLSKLSPKMRAIFQYVIPQKCRGVILTGTRNGERPSDSASASQAPKPDGATSPTSPSSADGRRGTGPGGSWGGGGISGGRGQGRSLETEEDFEEFFRITDAILEEDRAEAPAAGVREPLAALSTATRETVQWGYPCPSPTTLPRVHRRIRATTPRVVYPTWTMGASLSAADSRARVSSRTRWASSSGSIPGGRPRARRPPESR